MKLDISNYNSSKVMATCPECGSNTVTIDTSMLLTSNPPQYSGSCSSCRKGFYFDAAEINYNMSPFPRINRDIKSLEERVDEAGQFIASLEYTNKELKEEIYRLQDTVRDLISRLDKMEPPIG